MNYLYIKKTLSSLFGGVYLSHIIYLIYWFYSDLSSDFVPFFLLKSVEVLKKKKKTSYFLLKWANTKQYLNTLYIWLRFDARPIYIDSRLNFACMRFIFKSTHLHNIEMRKFFSHRNREKKNELMRVKKNMHFVIWYFLGFYSICISKQKSGLFLNFANQIKYK